MVLPFANPSQAMAAMPTAAPDMGDMMLQLDPRALIKMLTDMAPEFEPKYPYHFKRSDVKKPKPGAIWAEAKKEESRNLARVNRQLETVQRLRFGKAGVFPSDKQKRENKEQDEFLSSAMIDDNNLLCSILASFDHSYQKKVIQRAQRVGAQTLEDFCRMIREEELYRWANTGDMPLELVEAKIVTIYGQIASRHLCNLDDPDYPFDDMMADPASVYPIYGGTKGLLRVYRLMRMTVAQAFSEWGEPSKKDREKLHNVAGRDDESNIITVCEYADKWYRAACIQDGIELLPVTEHRYGEVPWIVQGGSAGEPLFTDTSRAGLATERGLVGGWHQSGPSDDWGMEHKLVSSIHLQQPVHDQLEAVMSRIITAIDYANDPALIITRDDLSGTRPLPDIDRRKGMRNELGMGETVQEVPLSQPPMDLQTFMQVMAKDKQTGSIPLGMYGQQTGSQQTGNSMSVATEQGMDHITPWVRALETYQTRKMEMRIRMWRNFGHLTRFRGGEEKPFMVMVNRPTTNQELSRELTPELIDAIGPRVNVTMTRIRIQELLQLANVAGTALPLGLTTRRRMAEKMGEHDYDRLREEWIEEVEWETMQNDEQMRRVIKIPMQLKEWADQATNPDDRAMYMALLDYWMEQQQMAMMAQAQPPMGPGGPPGGAPPMGMPSGMPPGGPPPPGPGSNTMNFAANPATAPGAQGGPVGRPTLPFG